MLIPGSNMHGSSLAGMIPLSLLNKIWDFLLLLKPTHHVGNVDTACGKSCSVPHKSTRRSAQTVNGAKQLLFGAGNSRERASVSTYIYIQNRTHGVRAIPQQTGGWRCTGNVKVTTKT